MTELEKRKVLLGAFTRIRKQKGAKEVVLNILGVRVLARTCLAPRVKPLATLLEVVEHFLLNRTPITM